MPFLFALYVFAYLDRVNLSYAALSIRRELGFSDTVYGAGAGLFFISYALFEVPSNLILLRIGPRRWIAAIMTAWGVLSTCMALVHTPHSFYLIRFLLGGRRRDSFPASFSISHTGFRSSKGHGPWLAS
jgi:sugar phosphate permease